MISRHLPYTSNSALLLMAPELLSLERMAQLDQSRFLVTTADTPRDAYLMRDLFHFSLAIFTDAVGYFALRASAQIVRGQWPKARILILGRAPIQLDDHLYDETLGHTSSGSTLLRMLEQSVGNVGLSGSNDLTIGLDHRSNPPRSQRRPATQESDPSKVRESISRTNDTSDWPADEQLRRRTH